MSENLSAAPYYIQTVPFQTIHLTEDNNFGIQVPPNSQELSGLTSLNNPQVLLESSEKPVEIIQEATEQSCIFQIVYPQDLSLNQGPKIVKRGRPKKKKEETHIEPNSAPTENVSEFHKTARTRSGRLVKLPKYIEKDFKKIETNTDEQEVQISDFKRVEEKENTKMEFPEPHIKKRVISAQYKCPKCLKAYLGRNKMIQHLKKYPDHGPLPEGFQQFNFDVWNYLFDITQKCKPGQRGVKFCEELSNLLHNVQLLKNALFKTVTDNKNCVNIDKVLGNAIGLPPGKYKFDENELYKDVTVLKLITNSDFFKPNVNKQKNVDETQEDEGDKNILNYNFSQKPEDVAPKIQDDNFGKKMDVDNQISLPSDLLSDSDNLLLNSLPNHREEFSLTGVDNSSNLLDTSTSSDEVMNVDQFVNERFKKIIEPDIELSNTSLNLDLPSLELFQFHTS